MSAVPTRSKPPALRRVSGLLKLLAFVVAVTSINLMAPASVAEELTGSISLGDGYAEITSSGPISRIRIASNLECRVTSHAHKFEHIDDIVLTYDVSNCDTYVAIGNSPNVNLVGPYPYSWGDLSDRTDFTPYGQQSVSGVGTKDNPFTITTTVETGDGDITLTQDDSYVLGDTYMTTTVKVEYSGKRDPYKYVKVYRIARCDYTFKPNEDDFFGHGMRDENWTACVPYYNTDSSWRFQLKGVTPTVTTMEASAEVVMDTLNNREPFANTVQVDDHYYSTLGLSWTATLVAGSPQYYVSQLAIAQRQDEVLDSDGDGLPDHWEVDGVHFHGYYLDLRALGADPYHKDLFLYLDWTSYTPSWWRRFRTGKSSQNYRPSSSVVDELKYAFEISPVDNPDGTTGINLHVQVAPTGHRISNKKLVTTSDSNDIGDKIMTEVNTRRLSRLNDAQQLIYHYGLVTAGLGTKNSGLAELPGMSFVVAVDTPGETRLNSKQRTRTIMHELGHNLGLGHGGSIIYPDAHVNCKLHYESVMNYLYQLQSRNNVVLGADYSRTEAQNVTGRAPEDWCEKVKEGSPETYNVHEDWNHLILNQVAMALLGSGAPLDSTLAVEEDVPDVTDGGPLWQDYSGTAEIVDPAVLVRGSSSPQKLFVDVTNTGSVSADYTIALTADGLDVSTQVSVPAATRKRVEIQVPANDLPQSGPLAVSVSLDAGHADVEPWNEVVGVLVVDAGSAEAAEVADLLTDEVLEDAGWDVDGREDVLQWARYVLTGALSDPATPTPAESAAAAPEPTSAASHDPMPTVTATAETAQPGGSEPSSSSSPSSAAKATATPIGGSRLPTTGPSNGLFLVALLLLVGGSAAVRSRRIALSSRR